MLIVALEGSVQSNRIQRREQKVGGGTKSKGSLTLFLKRISDHCLTKTKLVMSFASKGHVP